MEKGEPPPVALDEIDAVACLVDRFTATDLDAMKVLVSGASGFLGRHVTDCLLTRGHSVRAIVRPASKAPSWGQEVEVFRADLRNNDNIVPAFDDIDAVLHLAAPTSGNEDVQFASAVSGTERFLDAMARSSVKRLIHVSSLVVYDWSRAKGTMDENTPLLNDPYLMGGYTIAKVWQERIVTKFARNAFMGSDSHATRLHLGARACGDWRHGSAFW